jgi:hypothetical protein
MKYILLLLLSSNIFANTPQKWINTESLQDYKLMDSIEIVGTENIVLEQGSVLKVLNIVSLDFINVTVYETKIMSCDFYNDSSDLEIFDFYYNSELTVVGYELSNNCRLDLFIENIDLLKTGIFESLTEK